MLCMVVLVLFYLGLSRGILLHIYLTYSQVHCDTQCLSLGSLVFAQLGGIKVIT